MSEIVELKVLFTHTCNSMIVGFDSAGQEVRVTESDIQPVLDAIQAWNASQQVKTVEPEPTPDLVVDTPVKGKKSKDDPTPVEPTVSG